MRHAIEKPENRNNQQVRRGKHVVLTPRGKREARKRLELANRLKAAASTADGGPDGENVTDMASNDFIAFLRGR